MTDEPGDAPIRIEDDMRMIASEMETLHELAYVRDEGPSASELYTFQVRWGTLMAGRLKRLEHYYQAGELTENQEHRYRELRIKLKAATPLIERLSAAPPQVALED